MFLPFFLNFSKSEDFFLKIGGKDLPRSSILVPDKRPVLHNPYSGDC